MKHLNLFGKQLIRNFPVLIVRGEKSALEYIKDLGKLEPFVFLSLVKSE